MEALGGVAPGGDRDGEGDVWETVVQEGEKSLFSSVSGESPFPTGEK